MLVVTGVMHEVDNAYSIQNLSNMTCNLQMKTWLKTKLILIQLANRKNDLILTMTPEKQDKTLELSKHWSADSTPARNEVIMKRTYPVKSVKCDKICSNY